MKRRNATRNALFTSVISLLLCVSMLVGTTFAWFTDEVKSANNIIKSGNLDVTLEYWDGDSWENVQGSSDILAGNLWEPGYVDVAYLRMKNSGSLALKYQLGVNIESETPGTNQAGASFNLSDYIYFDVIENVNGQTSAYATRGDAMKVATENTKISAGYSKAGNLEADSDYVYLAMVVHMPEDVENEANHNGTAPTINLGINVYATQYTSESDSFDKYYDYMGEGGITSSDAPAEGTTGEYAVYSAESNVKIATMKVDAESVEDSAAPIEISIVPVEDDANVTIQPATQEANSYDISVSNIKDGNTTPIVVELNIGTGKSGVQVYHNGTPIASTYDETTGIVTFSTNSFSPFTIVYDAHLTTLEDLKEALNVGGTVKLGADISTGEGYVTIPAGKNVVLNLNGHTLSSEGDYTAICNEGTLTINGEGTIDAGWNAVWNNGGTLIVNSGTLEGDYSAIYSEGGSVTIDGGNLAVTADNGYNAAIMAYENTALEISGGTISTAIANTRVLDGRNSSTVKITGGTFNGTKSDAYEMGDIYVGDCQGEDSFVIDGGVFNCTVSTNYKLTVNDGTFNGQIYTSSIVPADYTLTINNGTFNLETEQIKVGGNGWKFQINGGIFAAREADVYVEEGASGSGTATINGGAFDDPASGKVDYRAYVLNTTSRQAIQLDMVGIYAKESLVIELWHKDTLLTTTTYAGRYPYKAPGYTTACVALKGGFASWDTTISEGVVLSDANIPDAVKVYVDGILTQTFTHKSGTILADKVNDYLALDSVQKTATTTE